MHKRARILSGLLVAGALAACGDTAAVGTRQPLVLSDTVTLTATGRADAPTAIIPFKIRFPDSRSYFATPPAFHPKTCALTSSHFTAEVPIPSEVNLPSYGRQTPPMTVRCVSEQFEYDETIRPVNLTQQALAVAAVAQVLIGYGLIGAAVTASAASQRDTSKDLIGYPLKLDLQ